MAKYNCTPNPFITENFVSNDYDRNQHNVCHDTIDFAIDQSICDRKCPQNCHQSFDTIILDKILMNSEQFFSIDTIFNIMHKPSKN